MRILSSLGGWYQASAIGVWEPAIGVVLEATSPWDDLLPASLLQGIKLNGDQISFLMKELGMDERLLGLSLKDREDALFEHVFMGRSDGLIRARQAHTRPVREEEFIPDGVDLGGVGGSC